MPPEAPGANVPVSQDDSVVSVAVWAVVSLLVHVTTSPTLAVMVAGLKAKFAIVAATVPVVVEGAHAAPPPPAALSDAAADSLGAPSLAGAALDGAADGADDVVVPPEQAATIRRRAAATASGRVRVIWLSSCFRVRGRTLLDMQRYADAAKMVSGTPA
jgi:hypothetical protein